MNICYFFVKDLIDKGISNVQCYSAEKTVTSFFIKPLQGRLFPHVRDFISGHQLISELEVDLDLAAPKEHVAIQD